MSLNKVKLGPTDSLRSKLRKSMLYRIDFAKDLEKGCEMFPRLVNNTYL